MSINNINVLAADALEERGWIQGQMESNSGSLCLVGALRACSPQAGDWLIAREVYCRLGHAESWNDEEGRTEAEVTAWLREHPVTDADIEATFGPQWEAVVALIRQAATLTQEKGRALAATWGDARWNAWESARESVLIASSGAGKDARRSAAAQASRDSARESVQGLAGHVAGHVAGQAAGALVVADLVGQHGLTQDHIDTLLGPWVSVMGDPRINCEE